MFNEGDVMAFIVMGLPILLGVALAAYGQWLRHKQLVLLMDERRMLIEKGVTNLPRLQLPSQSARRMGLFDLRAGIIFVAIALGLLIQHWLAPVSAGGVETAFIAVLGMLGMGLIAFHFIARAYARQEQPPTTTDQTIASRDAEEEQDQL